MLSAEINQELNVRPPRTREQARQMLEELRAAYRTLSIESRLQVRRALQSEAQQSAAREIELLWEKEEKAC